MLQGVPLASAGHLTGRSPLDCDIFPPLRPRECAMAGPGLVKVGCEQRLKHPCLPLGWPRAYKEGPAATVSCSLQASRTSKPWESTEVLTSWTCLSKPRHMW